jgi:hypothetical protein
MQRKHAIWNCTYLTISEVDGLKGKVRHLKWFNKCKGKDVTLLEAIIRTV